MKAFARAAPFTKRNFEVEVQKNYIMNALFQAVTINDEEVLESLMEALVDIGKVAYDYIAPFIEAIGTITLNFINSD